MHYNETEGKSKTKKFVKMLPKVRKKKLTQEKKQTNPNLYHRGWQQLGCRK